MRTFRFWSVLVVATLVVALFVPGVAAAQEEAACGAVLRTVNGSNAMVRDAANAATTTRAYPSGTAVSVLGRDASGTWLQVQVDGDQTYWAWYEIVRSMSCAVDSLAITTIGATTVPEAQPGDQDLGCLGLIGPEIDESFEGDEELGLICNPQTNALEFTGWQALALAARVEAVFRPEGKTYALTIQQIDGWQRIREGVAPGEYFSWNFLVDLACDRPLAASEVRWVKPIHLSISPSEEQGILTCSVRISRDLAPSEHLWEGDSIAMDPYDSSLAGHADATLAWFTTGRAHVTLDGEQSFFLNTSGCQDCPVPTTRAQGEDITEAQHWGAPASDHPPVAHDVAVIRRFERDFEGTLEWTITVAPGRSLDLWQGILYEQVPTTR